MSAQQPEGKPEGHLRPLLINIPDVVWMTARNDETTHVSPNTTGARLLRDVTDTTEIPYTNLTLSTVDEHRFAYRAARAVERGALNAV